MTSERDLYAGAVDQLSVATIILDEQGRLLNTNAVARALLDEGDGLNQRDQRLHIEGRNIHRELQLALDTIVKARHGSETSVVRALRVPRSAGRSDLAILLARGLSLAEVSEAQNISQHTARAQLKSIFSKTGVSRQAELVRLILKSVASLA
jgi:DNA-binding CsgD family transcriptional regulator